MNFNPWHHAPTGDGAPKTVNAIIEISKDSKAKYEIDKETGMLKLDRVLFAAFTYPVNYGFIPQTLGDDHDPLDILVLSQVSIEPLCLVKATVIGVMRMIDNDEGDDKIIAVAANDPSVNHIKNLDQLPPYFHSELRHFFEHYKILENKKVLIDEFQDEETAYGIITRSIELYNQTIRK
ncbi:MAG TPA: inorganic diphosphatase [Chitinophagales bacterium]|nr:inorganic diphosphatase [Chitinophagales bacterium]